MKCWAISFYLCSDIGIYLSLLLFMFVALLDAFASKIKPIHSQSFGNFFPANMTIKKAYINLNRPAGQKCWTHADSDERSGERKTKTERRSEGEKVMEREEHEKSELLEKAGKMKNCWSLENRGRPMKMVKVNVSAYCNIWWVSVRSLASNTISWAFVSSDSFIIYCFSVVQFLGRINKTFPRQIKLAHSFFLRFDFVFSLSTAYHLL